MSMREFEFQDGASNKFWNITLEGHIFVVHFGRLGTKGQKQEKRWLTADEARQGYEKLIAEKMKKGYVEKGAPAPLPNPLPASRGEGTGRKAVAAAVPVPMVPAVPEAVVSMSTERRIDLSGADWALATWRKPAAPKKSGPAAAFDREACAAKLLGLRFIETYSGRRPDWTSVELPEAMSREEAHYWFLAMTSVKENTVPATLAAELAKRTIDGSVTAKDVSEPLDYQRNGFITAEIGVPLRNLFPASEIAKLMLGDEEKNVRWLGMDNPFNFAWVAPNLPGDDLERLRAQHRPQITPAQWPDRWNSAPQFGIAAALGMSDELRAVVESWPDDAYREEYSDYGRAPQAIIFALGDPELVQKHMRRLRLRLNKPRYIAGWLAHTEWRALELVTDSILGARNKDDCEKLLAAFKVVKAPEAAGPMLRLSQQSKAPKAAREWLDQNIGLAVVGLTGVAAGRGPLADAAIAQLRDWKRKGFGPQIADAVKALPADHQKRVKAEVVDHEDVVLQPFDAKTTPDWLAKGVADAATQKAPSWVTPGNLPPLAVDGHRLSDPHVAAVLAALQASKLGEPHPLIADLRKHADSASADEFAWKLFERWITEGAASKEKWGMAALGALGNDTSVLKLTPMVRAWPGESQHPRAVLGLEVLRAIGTDTALMQLNGIAQKLKFQGLKTKAREFMEAIAKDKGLSRAELEDRVVPDFDLDEHGRRVFDFGARRFNFVFGPELKPMVRDDDEKAKLRDNLPEPGAKDDAAKAAEAIAAWKVIKKQIKDVAKVQAGRLEQAMVTGRRWKTADFETLVLRHPLMTHLARLLLWGVYDGKTLRETFRITEDQECVNVDDEPYALRADAAIGLVHALQLDDGAREAWGQRFADYKIMPPFPQLGRAVHRLEKGEEAKTSLERAVKLPAPTLVFGLEQLGWVRGAGMDNGFFDEHSRQFPDASLTAVVNHEGASYGYIRPEDMVAVTGCCFVNGLRAPSGFGHGLEEKLRIKLGDVDPIVISETLLDMAVLAAKEKS
jgi:predicted DNA-binding WGR domain protein